MATESNKQRAREFIERIWNDHNLEAVDDFVTPDFVQHDPLSGEARGPEGMRRFVSTYLDAFPDLQFTIEDMVAEGDRVVTHWTSRGTHKGALMGIEPTNRSVEVSGITIARMADGQTREAWVVWDALGLLNQLGVVPRPDEVQQA